MRCVPIINPFMNRYLGATFWWKDHLENIYRIFKKSELKPTTLLQVFLWIDVFIFSNYEHPLLRIPHQFVHFCRTCIGFSQNRGFIGYVYVQQNSFRICLAEVLISPTCTLKETLIALQCENWDLVLWCHGLWALLWVFEMSLIKRFQYIELYLA